ncbi:MAG: YraN family protein [Ignavibacteria bacterium]
MNQSAAKAGHEGEDLACQFLIDKGLEILERNYHFHKRGEIDIVAREKETLVFVEVKFRKSMNYGSPEEAITKNKMSQVRKLAQAYLFDKGIYGAGCRFDVVAIQQKEGIEPEIRYYPNAF